MKTFSIMHLKKPKRYMTWQDNDKNNSFVRKTKGACLAHWLRINYSERLRTLDIENHQNWRRIKIMAEVINLDIKLTFKLNGIYTYSVTEIKTKPKSL